MSPRKSTSSTAKKSSPTRKTTSSSSASKRKTTSSSPKRKTTSSSPKRKLKWAKLVEKEWADILEILFPEFEFDIEQIDLESSKINGIKEDELGMRAYFANFGFDEILYFDCIKSQNAAEYTIVSRSIFMGAYYYFQVLFYSEGNINDRNVDRIVVDLYECKSWSSLYKKLPTSLKRKIDKGRRGNKFNEKTGNEHEIICDETSPILLKKMVEEWFASGSVKDWITKNKMKNCDIANQEKKQLSALTGVEKVCYISLRKNINTKKLVILGKRKDKKYIYLHNHISKNSKKSNETKCEMDVEIFDSWKDLWNKLHYSIREEIIK